MQGIMQELWRLMMSWYKLIFKQNQPIHVGFSKWGVVKETDIFISGQTMWGALTNMYAQKYNKNPNDIKTYFEQISNFFPSFDGKNILKPQYKDGEFYLGDYSEEKFRYYFVDTSVHTAIIPLNRSAKDESLHELDFILPKPKQKIENFTSGNLYWIGIINVEPTISNFEEFFHKLKIYLGADCRYGYGELEFVDKISIDNTLDEFFLEDCEIKIKENKSLPYFVDLQSLNSKRYDGEIRLIAEFDFLKNLPECKISRFCLSVGSKILDNVEGLTLRLYKGILIKNDK